MLKFLGVEVQVAMDGQECIELSHKDAYDLILMDIQMPNLDGLDTTRLIRKIPGYQNVPVIAISAGITMGEKELSKKSGMNDFLSKPIELDQLSEILQKWLLKDLGSSTN